MVAPLILIFAYLAAEAAFDCVGELEANRATYRRSRDALPPGASTPPAPR